MADDRPTLAVVGAGGRGGTYASWVADHPDRARVVAVAEPREAARRRIVEAHQVPPEAVFASWQDLLAAGKQADAAIVATQDQEHVEPAVALAGQGYHLLLEKPMAPTVEGCRAIVAAVERAGVLFAVGHVLRYTPYTRALTELLASGRIGAVVSVQHLEPVGWWHQAHSFVRGNWRREETSSSMLMAKSCHDIDWLRHVVGRPIERVSSFGSLTHFRPENAPAGAAERCLDCAVEPDCPYSAPRLYLGRLRAGQRGWPVDVLTEERPTEATVLTALAEGPYGRCVYHCDNDVVDHQVVGIEFAGGVTATFTMTAFTEQTHRRTQIFGTRGSIDGDGERITVFDFLTARTEVVDTTAGGADAASGHGGGDDGLMDGFTAALAGDTDRILSGPAESLETHLAVFAAEQARHAATVVPV